MIKYNIIRRPLDTEKTNIQKENFNQLSFEVAQGANRIEIKRAVEEIFNVRVRGIRTINIKGKSNRETELSEKEETGKSNCYIDAGEHIDFLKGLDNFMREAYHGG